MLNKKFTEPHFKEIEQKLEYGVKQGAMYINFVIIRDQR